MIQVWDFTLNFWFLATLGLIYFTLGLLMRGSGGTPARYR